VQDTRNHEPKQNGTEHSYNNCTNKCCTQVCYSMLRYVTVCCCMLQYVTVCYGMLRYVAVCYSMLQYTEGGHMLAESRSSCVNICLVHVRTITVYTCAYICAYHYCMYMCVHLCVPLLYVLEQCRIMDHTRQ
jgi:hypothetical protein